MRHLLVALLAIALASPFSAPREGVRAQEIAAAKLRPGTDSQESARLDEARHTEIVARDSRVPSHGVRGDTTPIALSSASSAIATAHARTSGLSRAPLAVRRLAIPFDATAPPVSQLI